MGWSDADGTNLGARMWWTWNGNETQDEESRGSMVVDGWMDGSINGSIDRWR